MSIDPIGISRRALLFGAAAASASALAPSRTWPLLITETSPAPQAPPLEEFNYDQITILGDRQLAQAANVRSVLLGLDQDSLLKPFREMAGQPGPGTSLGGWYAWNPMYDFQHDAPGFAPGHSFGQWLSAMARLHAASGDPALREKALSLNDQLARILTQPDFRGYFAQTRFPAYSYDKLVCGLMDAHRLAGDPSALATLDRVTAAALPSLPGHAVDREIPWKPGKGIKDISWMWDESYTMPENLYLVSAQFSDPSARARYRAMAEAYLDDATYFAPLARGQDVLGGRHAYSYVNALSSAMQAYLTGGSAMHFEAAKNAFNMLEQQSFATGGWGADEKLVPPGSDALALSLTHTHRGFETPCGSYAHMKLTRYLLRATRNGHYGDSMERVLLNTVLGALPLEPDGHAFYYSDYNISAERIYFDHPWPCCSGTLPQVVADYGINTYFREAAVSGRSGAVWVNLYQPSELRWREGGAAVVLKQAGSYPDSGEIRLLLTLSQPADFTLHLRIPGWASGNWRLRINGASQPLINTLDPLSANGFIALHQTWHTGDLIELTLPLTPRLEPLPGHPDTVALLSGPLVLFPIRQPGELGPILLPSDALLGAQRKSVREWRVKQSSGDRLFVPFTELGNRPYSTYVNTRLS
jgi:DUF1680 family protein